MPKPFASYFQSSVDATPQAVSARREANLGPNAVYSVGEPHPLLAPGSALMHDDAANSDTTPLSGPTGEFSRLLSVERRFATKLREWFRRAGGKPSARGRASLAGFIPTFSFARVNDRPFLIGASFTFKTTDLLAIPGDWNLSKAIVGGPLPPRDLSVWKLITKKQRAKLFRTTAGGAYFCLLGVPDGSVDVLVPAIGGTIQLIRFDGATFQRRRRMCLCGHTMTDAGCPRHAGASLLARGDALVAALPCWPQGPVPGRSERHAYWWVSRDGVVGVADGSDAGPPDDARTLRLGRPINNSIAVGKNGMFVATDRALHRVAYVDGCVREVWRYDYDAKPGANDPTRHCATLGRLNEEGTGTTPTLLGDDYVAITDAATRMKVVVVRQGSPTAALAPGDFGRVVPEAEAACIEVLGVEGGTERAACENSLVAYRRKHGNSPATWRIILANTWGYKSPFDTILHRNDPVDTCDGAAAAVDGECVELTDDGAALTLRSVWKCETHLGSATPKLCLTDKVFYVYTPERSGSTWKWGVSGISAEDGATTVYKKVLFSDAHVREVKPPRTRAGTRRAFRVAAKVRSKERYVQAHDNAFGTLVLTGGGVAIAAWHGLRWLRDA